MAPTESHATGPSAPVVRDLTFGALLREAAEAVSDRVALVAGVTDPTLRRSWTYRELLADAEVAARALRARFEPGERVAVWAPNWGVRCRRTDVQPLAEGNGVNTKPEVNAGGPSPRHRPSSVVTCQSQSGNVPAR